MINNFNDYTIDKFEQQVLELMQEIMQHTHHAPFIDWMTWIQFKRVQIHRLLSLVSLFITSKDTTKQKIAANCHSVLNNLDYIVGELYKSICIILPTTSDII